MGAIRRYWGVAFLWVLAAAASELQHQPRAEGDSFVTTVTAAAIGGFLPPRGAGAFMNFYMPWCKYSKKLTLDYELLGHAFHRVRDIAIGKVNCEHEKPLCEKFGVTSYPTLLWFPRGSSSPESYTGGRSSQEMINFVNSKAGVDARPKRRPNKIGKLNGSNFAAATGDKGTDALVQFLIPGDEVCKHFEVEYDMLATALNAEPHVTMWTLDASQHPEIAGEYGVKTFPMVKLFRRNGKGVATYNGKYTAASLLPWVNEHADTSRLLSGVSNSTTGRLAGLDALVDRLTRSPPDSWAEQAQAIKRTASKMEGESREYGNMYIKDAPPNDVLESHISVIADEGAVSDEGSTDALSSLIVQAVMDLTSGVDGNDLLTSKRQEINERLVQEGDPAVRTRLNAHRNIIASIQGKVQRGGMLRQLGLVGVIDGGGSSTGKQAENKPMAGSSERKDEL